MKFIDKENHILTYTPEILITDEFRGYNSIGKNYVHLTIDHSEMFSDGDLHTNNIESFWATLKRGVYGIYHHISLKYMQRYADEFCFRYNHRKDDMFGMVLGQSSGNIKQPF
ncbi:MAG: IS1595 family transposase [Bacillota bacterium]|nr:IS1595 family transposase [Bacillota bacterium]